MEHCDCSLIHLPQNALTDNSSKIFGVIFLLKYSQFLYLQTLSSFTKNFALRQSPLHSRIRWLPITSITNLVHSASFRVPGLCQRLSYNSRPFWPWPSRLLHFPPLLQSGSSGAFPSPQQHSPSYSCPRESSSALPWRPRSRRSFSLRPSSITPVFFHLSQLHFGSCQFSSWWSLKFSHVWVFLSFSLHFLKNTCRVLIAQGLEHSKVSVNVTCYLKG